MSLVDRKIAVIGVGVSGVASVQLADRLGASIIAVNSGNTVGWSDRLNEIENCLCVSQEDSSLEEVLLSCAFIVLSPGIARESKFLGKVLEAKIPVISEIEFAYRYINHDSTKIISVTGTNGKTTTVTILDILARGSGKKVFLGGNIGTPLATYALEVLESKRELADLIILELSSFQLESMDTFKSDTAAILNISPSHGERYENVADYAFAKFKICDGMQEDKTLFVGDLGDFTEELKPKCQVQKVSCPSNICEISSELKHSFHLIGPHNLSNLKFATVLLEEVGVDWRKGIRALDDFHGVKYRLQKCSVKSKLQVFNDAKSTNWESTLTAIKASVFSLPDLKILLILGGKLRGEGDSLGTKLDSYKENIDKIYLYGESGKLIKAETNTCFDFEYFDDLEKVIKAIALESSDGVLLFSPAFPSFDLYDNYIRRGEHFDCLLSEYLES